MRLYPNQLNSHLKKNLLPSYLLSAEEPLITQECRQTIIANAMKKGFSDRDILHVDKNFNWDIFREATANLSLFGDRKIIDLRFPTEAVEAKGAKALERFYSKDNPDTHLIITLPKLNAATQRSKWFKAFDQMGAWLPVKPLSGRFFLDWIARRSKTLGLNCSPDAIKLIAERVEGNLLAASQELDKLSLLISKPNEPITAKHIQAVVAKHARYDLFKWIDTVLLGETNKALNMLNGLQAEGTDPVLILWGLTRELRVIYHIAAAKQHGTSLNEALQQQKIWKNRQPIVTRAVSRLEINTLYDLFEKAHQADLAIKGLTKNSVWTLLNSLTIDLCRPHALQLLTP